MSARRTEALRVLRDALLWAHVFSGRRPLLAAAAALEVYLAEPATTERAGAGVIVLAERRARRGRR